MKIFLTIYFSFLFLGMLVLCFCRSRYTDEEMDYFIYRFACWLHGHKHTCCGDYKKNCKKCGEWERLNNEDCV